MTTDESIRIGVFKWLEQQSLIHRNVLPISILRKGVPFKGQHIILIGAQGIWKPKQMSLPISITTIPNGTYDDGIGVNDIIRYKYRGVDPYHKDNVMLREMKNKDIPLVYFYRIQPGKYFAMWPVFIQGDDIAELTFSVTVDDQQIMSHNIADRAATIGRRSYMTTMVKQRLHQSAFRVHVLGAYSGQCTLCQLKHSELLDAAHIIPDSEPGGLPIVQNGLALCKIHHAAYDHNIIGISPDYKVNIREDVLEEIDGPMLKYGLQSLDGQKILLPRLEQNWPDQARLDYRYQGFVKAG